MNPKTINLISNFFMLLNFVIGLLMLHWGVTPIFGIIHAGMRIAYLSTSEKLAQASQSPEAQINVQKTVTAPPMIRNMASVVTGFIVAGILYAVGYGIRYGFNTITG